MRDDYTSMCIPAGKENSKPSQRIAVTGAPALGSQPHQLLAPYLLSSVKWGYLHGVVKGVYGVDIKHLVQCSALNNAQSIYYYGIAARCRLRTARKGLGTR